MSNKILQLPESIFLLRNLHTLSLKYCTKLKELPRGIEQLTRMCILELPLSLIYMPSGIGKLTTLKPLSGHFNIMEHGMLGGLRELKDMSKLSGLLCISGLKNIGDVEYSRTANLASKPNLQNLILNFKEDHSSRGCENELLKLNLCGQSNKNENNKNDKEIQEVVLQSLQPHGNLTKLAILNYGGRIFPTWLLNPLLPKLTTLILNLCIEPNFLPQFGQLPYLRFLYISIDIVVRNAEDELNTYSMLAEYGSSKQPREHSYPSLEVLCLCNMLNLVEWQAHDDDFPHLKKLVIENCPKLWKIAKIPQEVNFKYCPRLKFLTCPSVMKKLKIHECGFREIMFRSISENLTISNCVELTSINWVKSTLFHVRISHRPILRFPLKDVLHSVTQRAEIYDCPRMGLGERYFYQRDTTIKELMSFENNEIRLLSSDNNSPIPLLENPFTLFLTKEDFQEAELLTCEPWEGVSCQHIMLNLASLVRLEILRCTKIISVAGLDNLSNVKHLSISYCPELCNWKDITLPLSLEFLNLYACDKLSSLPLLSVQSHSSTLKVLMIMKCQKLAVLEGFHGLMKLKDVKILHCRSISISPASESFQLRPHITIGDCPLMRDWCQRNNIKYHELKPIEKLTRKMVEQQLKIKD